MTRAIDPLSSTPDLKRSQLIFYALVYAFAIQLYEGVVSGGHERVPAFGLGRTYVGVRGHLHKCANCVQHVDQRTRLAQHRAHGVP